jgi:hypothetical protein
MDSETMLYFGRSLPSDVCAIQFVTKFRFLIHGLLGFFMSDLNLLPTYLPYTRVFLEKRRSAQEIVSQYTEYSRPTFK